MLTLSAKISSKGQITIPRQIRLVLGVAAGDRVAFEQNESGEIRVVPVGSRGPFARYRGIGNGELGSGRKAILDRLRELRGA